MLFVGLKRGKCLILFVPVLLIGVKLLSLLTLVKIGLLRQLCSEKVLQSGKIHSNNKILLEKVAKS